LPLADEGTAPDTPRTIVNIVMEAAVTAVVLRWQVAHRGLSVRRVAHNLLDTMREERHGSTGT